MTPGSFGVTGEASALDDQTVAAIQDHSFTPIRKLQWRNADLAFGSPEALIASLEAPCEDPMLVRGRILDTSGKPISSAKIDVWQANDEGFYDVQQKGIQPDFNLRGVFRTGTDGTYEFRAVKPKFYPIPDDGPVGKLLVALGRHPFRPAHFHYILEADGFETLTTHIFDPDDPYIHSDAVFGVKESLMAKFDLIEDEAAIKEAGMDGPFYLVEHDFVLAKA